MTQRKTITLLSTTALILGLSISPISSMQAELSTSFVTLGGMKRAGEVRRIHAQLKALAEKGDPKAINALKIPDQEQAILNYNQQISKSNIRAEVHSPMVAEIMRKFDEAKNINPSKEISAIIAAKAEIEQLLKKRTEGKDKLAANENSLEGKAVTIWLPSDDMTIGLKEFNKLKEAAGLELQAGPEQSKVTVSANELEEMSDTINKHLKILSSKLTAAQKLEIYKTGFDNLPTIDKIKELESLVEAFWNEGGQSLKPTDGLALIQLFHDKKEELGKAQQEERVLYANTVQEQLSSLQFPQIPNLQDLLKEAPELPEDEGKLEAKEEKGKFILLSLTMPPEEAKKAAGKITGKFLREERTLDFKQVTTFKGLPDHIQLTLANFPNEVIKSLLHYGSETLKYIVPPFPELVDKLNKLSIAAQVKFAFLPHQVQQELVLISPAIIEKLVPLPPESVEKLKVSIDLLTKFSNLSLELRNKFEPLPSEGMKKLLGFDQSVIAEIISFNISPGELEKLIPPTSDNLKRLKVLPPEVQAKLAFFPLGTQATLAALPPKFLEANLVLPTPATLAVLEKFRILPPEVQAKLALLPSKEQAKITVPSDEILDKLVFLPDDLQVKFVLLSSQRQEEIMGLASSILNKIKEIQLALNRITAFMSELGDSEVFKQSQELYNAQLASQARKDALTKWGPVWNTFLASEQVKVVSLDSSHPEDTTLDIAQPLLNSSPLIMLLTKNMIELCQTMQSQTIQRWQTLIPYTSKDVIQALHYVFIRDGFETGEVNIPALSSDPKKPEAVAQFVRAIAAAANQERFRQKKIRDADLNTKAFKVADGTEVTFWGKVSNLEKLDAFSDKTLHQAMAKQQDKKVFSVNRKAFPELNVTAAGPIKKINQLKISLGFSEAVEKELATVFGKAPKWIGGAGGAIQKNKILKEIYDASGGKIEAIKAKIQEMNAKDELDSLKGEAKAAAPVAAASSDGGPPPPDAPDAPAFGGPDAPAFGGPDAPAFGGPDAPAFGGPDAPAFGGPPALPLGGSTPGGELKTPAATPVATPVAKKLSFKVLEPIIKKSLSNIFGPDLLGGISELGTRPIYTKLPLDVSETSVESEIKKLFDNGQLQENAYKKKEATTSSSEGKDASVPASPSAASSSSAVFNLPGASAPQFKKPTMVQHKSAAQKEKEAAAKQQKELALKMLAKGMTPEVVSEITEMPLEAVKALQIPPGSAP